MKNKKVTRLFATMLAVVLCMTAFSVTAFAGCEDGDYYTGEPPRRPRNPPRNPPPGAWSRRANP